MFKKILRVLGKSLITVAVLLVIIGGLMAVKIQGFKAMAAAGEGMTQPATSVTTAKVETMSWKSSITGVGNITAVQGVTVTTEIPGKVVKIHFESGDSVEEGAILLELDASTERAQLNAAVASADLAKISVDRSRELYKKEAIAKSELDAAEARISEAEAQVANLRAVLSKKIIRAPFAGRLGIREVNLGQFVGSGQPVVSLQSVDPVYVDFFVPQQKLAKISEGYEVEVALDDGKETKVSGEVSAIASEVDAATRNIMVRATLSNESGVLRPGMFVEASVYQPEGRDVLVVPSTAILFAPYGNSVFIAEKAEEGEGLVATQKFIRLGEARGDFVEIVSGLEADDEVVTTGAFKLRNGAAITPQNDKALEYSMDPKPVDA